VEGRRAPSGPRDPDDLAGLGTEQLLELLGGRPRGTRRPPGPLDLVDLSRTGVAELVAERGLPRSGARRLAAAFELGRRLSAHRRPSRPSVRSPARVLRLLGDEVRGCEQERFFVLLLDGKHALRRVELVSVGTLTSSLVHPREVFRPAVRAACAAVVCAHNHPSGDPEPSAEDVEVTRRLLEAGRLLGIPLLDHVVLGEGRYVSLRERMGF
jgi:DNA repair protein RadC